VLDSFFLCTKIVPDGISERLVVSTLYVQAYSLLDWMYKINIFPYRISYVEEISYTNSSKSSIVENVQNNLFPAKPSKFISKEI
jgi:hypothetical protein